MLTLFGSLLGFGTSFLPKILDYFQDRQDKAHELAMQRELRETQKQLGEINLEIAQTQAAGEADIARYEHDVEIVKRAGRIAAFFSAGVRPYTSYWFITLFMVTKSLVFGIFLLEAYLLYETAASSGAIVEGLIQGGQHVAKSMSTIWDNQTVAFLATIISYWFGDRTRRKAFGR